MFGSLDWTRTSCVSSCVVLEMSSPTAMHRSSRLRARKATIKLHGSGDVREFASEEAKVRLHGSGDVTVKGSPKIRDAKVAGSGDIDFDD